MVSTWTNNLGVENPAAGEKTGIWGPIVDTNMVYLDSATGTAQNIGMAGGSLQLTGDQARSLNLIFTGNLPSNATVTIPNCSSLPVGGTNVILSGRTFVLQNQCGNSSLYTITMTTTAAGAQVICVPPYEPVDVVVDSTASPNPGSIKFRNLGRVGTFWDYAGSSVPNWVSGCTVPPYLNCDGTTFSSATYPALADLIGTTLPDSRGRYRATLNQGQSRITTGSCTGGIDGSSNFASGGSETTVLSSLNMPPSLVTDTHKHQIQGAKQNIVNTAGVFAPLDTGWSSAGAATFGVTNISSFGSSAIFVGSTSPYNFSNLPPTIVAGITMIRSA